jgi:ankyrin repeat protein
MKSEDDELDDLLQSIDFILFPADEVPRKITIECSDCDGDTPLHVFLWRGDDASAVRLVKAGANVNAIGDMGETPFHVAIRKAQIGTLALMLKAGAKLDIVSQFGQTPVELAKTKERLDALEQAQLQANSLFSPGT